MTDAQNVSTYITAETERLKAKKSSVDGAYNAQMRGSILNESYRKRYSKYIEIMVVLIFSVLAYLGINALPSMFPVIPESAIDAIMIILFSGVFIYLVFAFMELNSRSRLNYDEVYTAPMDAGKLAGSNNGGGNGSGLVDTANAVGTTCVGEQCCNPNGVAGSTRSIWDSASGKCKTAFTTLEQAYTYKEISIPMQSGIPVPTYTGTDGASGPSTGAMPIMSGTQLNVSMF